MKNCKRNIVEALARHEYCIKFINDFKEELENKLHQEFEIIDCEIISYDVSESGDSEISIKLKKGEEKNIQVYIHLVNYDELVFRISPGPVRYIVKVIEEITGLETKAIN